MSAASAKATASATKAAERAFTARSPLPLLEQPAPAGAELGRRWLGGAFFIRAVRIRPDASQPRRTADDATQQELNASVRELGILQPIAVRYVEADNIYLIISGERRYQAALATGMEEIPCWVQTPKDREILPRQIVENWQRADLHPYDLADALAQMRDGLGYTQKEIAQLTAKPESEISRLLSLLKVNPLIQREARKDSSGLLSRRHLTAIAQLKPEDQQEVMIQIQQKGMTAIETERLVKKSKTQSIEAPKRGAPGGVKFRYVTEHAVVTIAFRNKNATTKDVIRAVADVQSQIKD